MKRLAIGGVALLLSACALMSPPAQLDTTRHLLDRTPTELPSVPRRASSMLVPRPEASAIYDTTQMAYAEHPDQVAYFRDNTWAQPPPDMIQALVVETLARTGAFADVAGKPASAAPSFTLRIQLVDLIQDFSVDPPVVRLSLRGSLIGTGGAALATQQFSVQQPLRERNPQAGVAAANEAMAGVLRDLARFVVEHAS